MEIKSEYILTKEQLKFDLLISFYKAKKHKSSKLYVKKFEKNLDKNIDELCEELFNHTYKQGAMSCFVINKPKKREIFASNFRDRIVHHLYYGYTHELFERNFIYDTYSCIKRKGTHFGINRLEKHILSESNNYQKECYALKMDIKGYFMSINRLKLLEITEKYLSKYRYKKYNDNKRFCDIIDFNFIYYLNKTIILTNPIENCNLISNQEDYIGLPDTKRMSNAKKNCGLPIGNLTSQLFSNVYLSIFDNFVKRKLNVKHYGRYVDDFYIISNNKNKILEVIPIIKKFLKEELLLDTADNKTIIVNVLYGVEFLGCFLKPYRHYISNQSLKRMINDEKLSKESIISKIGILSHYKSYNIIKKLFYE